MKDFRGKVAVITGAGSGMGRELAAQLSSLGAAVAICDWNADNLSDTLQIIEHQGGTAWSDVFDVSDYSAVDRFAAQVMERFGQVDLLINNAGIALEHQTIDQTSLEAFESIFGVNFWGVVYFTKAFLPELKKRTEAAVVNISSAFGLVGYAGQGPYVATKFAVRGFTETLRQELHRTRVNAISVHPGAIKTNIVRHIQTDNTAMKDKLVRRFDQVAKISSAEAARQIINGIRSRKKRVLIGKEAWIVDVLARLMPQRYDEFLLKAFGVD